MQQARTALGLLASVAGVLVTLEPEQERAREMHVEDPHR
jgi:hypothetical protein